MNNRLSNIELLRCFAVLSLVAWHSICVYVGWTSFLPDISESIGDTLITKIYKYASRVLIPSANMPLFTAISGFVYAYLRTQGKYQDIKDFYKKKVKRLLIPYFIIGTLVVFTIADWKPISILYGDAHHLWYCAMLFWCFVFIRLFEKVPSFIKILIIVIGIVFNFVTVPFNYNILGLFTGIKYLPFFIIGFYLPSYLSKLQLGGAKIIIAMIWIICLFLAELMGGKAFILLRSLMFVLFLFAIVPTNIKVGNFVTKISSYSFGIYVFHEWILWNVAHIDALHPFIIKHQVLYPLIAFVLTLSISILLTKYSLKTKVGKFLLAS